MRHRNEAAFDQNVAVGETGQHRCHENAIAYDGRGAETGATLHHDEIAVGEAKLGGARPIARIGILDANRRLDPEIRIKVEPVIEVSDNGAVQQADRPAA